MRLLSRALQSSMVMNQMGSEQMPGFDFQVRIDELGGHIFREDIERENAVML